jgi:hypothetical protein
MRTGNGAGDPSPAFDRRHGVVLMAQLENIGGQGGPFVAQGDVSVSRSTDGGVNWSEPTTVFQGQGAGIGPANQAVFYDKEWLTVDNNPTSPFYGRAYVTTSASTSRSSATPTPADPTTATSKTPCTPADNSKQTITGRGVREAPLPHDRSGKAQTRES